MTTPHRRWRVTLDVHADTFDDLVRELEWFAGTMALHPGAETGRREIVSGAGTATITEDPSVTPESYQAAADAWLAERRAATRTAREVAS